MEHEQHEIPAGSVEADFLAWRSHGDAAALERVFDAVAPDLLKLGVHLVGQAADAEDLVQQTFLAALQNPASWRAGRPLRPFLTTILRRRAIDAHRRRRPTEDIEAGLDWVAEQAAPEDAAMAAEMSAELAKALDALREPYRQAMLLRLRHGMRSADIAHVLGLSPGAVRMRLSRGTELLRGLLPAALGGVLAAMPFSGRGLAAVREATLAAARALPPVGAGTAPGAPGAPGLARPLASFGLQGGLGWVALALPLLLGVLALVLDGRRGAETRPQLAAGPLDPGDALERQEPGGLASLGGTSTRAAAAAGAERVELNAVLADAGGPAALTVVVRHAGTPRADVRVELIDPQRLAGYTRLVAETNDRGRVRFEGLVEGCYRLAASNGMQRRVLLAAGEDRTEELESDFPLSVHVAVIGSDGLPVPGARIEARDRAHVWFELGGTDGAGRCAFELAERPPVLRAVAAGYCDDGGSGVPDLTSPEQPLVLHLKPGGASLAVRVRNRDGTDIGAARLRMGLAREPRPPRLGADGIPLSLPQFKRFEVRELYANEQELHGLLPGQYWLLAEGAHSGAAAAVLELGAGEQQSVEFVLPQSTELVVRAFDAASMPVEGATLFVRSELGGDLVRGETDAAGELRLRGLLPGVWSVLAEDQQAALGSAEVTELRGATLDVVLERARVLGDGELGSLVVLPPRPGDGIAEFALPRFELFDDQNRHLETLPFGLEPLEVAALVPGRYRVRVLAVGCAPLEIEGLEVLANETLEVDPGVLGLGGYVWLSSDAVHSLRLTREGVMVAAGRVRPGEPLLLGPLEPGTLALETGRDGEPPERYLELRPGERLEVQL